MAHEVETMFSAKEVPWHGLGTITEGVLTAQEALETAGLDWDVKLHSLYAQIGKNKKKVSNRFAIVRQQDESILGTVGSRYEPFQNREAFQFADNMVDSGEAKYETAGSLKDGRVVFMTMKVPMDLQIAGEDAHDMYIVLRASHDGLSSVNVAVTPIRVVCQNTMTFALATASRKWAAPHTSTLAGKVQEARESIGMTFKYAEEFNRTATKMVKTTVTDAMLHDFLETIIPVRPKTPEVIADIEMLYNESEVNGYKGTAWGAMNAVTEYFDHFRETKTQEAVMLNTLDGKIAGIRDHASRVLLAI